MTQEISSTGDICHYNITNLKEKDSRRLFPTDLSVFNICTIDCKTRNLTQRDIEELPYFDELKG